MRVLSNEQWQIMQTLKQCGAMNLAGLRSSLPADGRTAPVRNASLCRSLRRLRKRGLITAVNHMYWRPDAAGTVKVRAADSLAALREKAMAIMHRQNV